MTSNERTRKLLLKHYTTYPKMQITDLFKFLHQSSFGCEHMISSKDVSIEYIRREYSALKPTRESIPTIDRLDGAYSRVHLDCLNGGLTPETLGTLFFLSAKNEPDGKRTLTEKLQVARKLISDGNLNFDISEFERKADEWQAQGFPAIHHSEIFRASYNPAYRVIDNRFLPLIPLFSAIDKALAENTKNIIVAIDGGSASGKTTLGSFLEKIYDCNIFHVDDFFLRPEQRTAERFAEAGGNFDRERFLEEILLPLSKSQNVNYRRFDCSTQSLSMPLTVPTKRLTIIEGAYSMHSSLAHLYDLSVYIDIDAETQRERILKRNSPQLAQRFFNEWIPLELEYFSKMKVRERCDISISAIHNNNLEE